MPCVGVWCAQSLGSVEAEAEYKPAQHSACVVHWIEYFVVRAVGALAELISAECKVLVWGSSDQAADWAVSLWVEPAAVRWELVQVDTGLFGLQMQQGSSVLAAVLAGWLLQSVGELMQDILMQAEPAVGMGAQSSERFAGLEGETSENLLLLPAAVGGLVLGNSVQHVVAQQVLQTGVAAHLKECN